MNTMATPRKANSGKASQRRSAATVTYNRNDPNHVLVDPRWLAKVFGYTVVAAFVCAYLCMCALFRYGSWQWVLHPTHTALAAGTGLPSELVHFGPDSSGTPQLTGEFFQAEPTAGATVIYLRPGDGQLDFADAPIIRMLRDKGLNVLAFDYRGYGRSASKPHPSEANMQQDAEAAYAYLIQTRGVAPNLVVVYGAGVGASIATELAAAHPDAAALLLRNATADTLGTVRSEKRARMFPVGLLLKDRFALAGLDQLATPKLLWDIGSQPNNPEEIARAAAYRAAASPKLVVTLPQPDPQQEKASLDRFLDAHEALLPQSEMIRLSSPANLSGKEAPTAHAPEVQQPQTK